MAPVARKDAATRPLIAAGAWALTVESEPSIKTRILAPDPRTRLS
jgi:hypothetical protein